MAREALAEKGWAVLGLGLELVGVRVGVAQVLEVAALLPVLAREGEGLQEEREALALELRGLERERERELAQGRAQVVVARLEQILESGME